MICWVGYLPLFVLVNRELNFYIDHLYSNQIIFMDSASRELPIDIIWLEY
jgi:hypothetical protein